MLRGIHLNWKRWETYVFLVMTAVVVGQMDGVALIPDTGTAHKLAMFALKFGALLGVGVGQAAIRRHPKELALAPVAAAPPVDPPKAA